METRATIPTGRGSLAGQQTALLQNLAAVCTWALAPSMIRAFTDSFPVHFQNSCRYLASLLVLWPVLLLTAGRGRLREYVRILRAKAWRIALVAFVNYAYQACYTYSLFFVAPSVMTLVSQTQVLFGVVFAVLFFADERAFVGTPAFLLGSCLALCGVALVVAGGPSFGTPSFTSGVLLVVGSAFCWSLLGTLLRALLPEVPPLLSITAVFTAVTPLFIATYAVAHGGLPIPRAPASDWILMTASGLLAIGLGQSLYYRAVPILGIAVCSSIGLLVPLLASLVSYVAHGDRLASAQIAGAVVLLCGSYLVIRARFRKREA
jgi:drug/metabolite transporter (DMT)-like permease